MKILEYLTGKEGILILGLVVTVVYFVRKWKEKRYFKSVEKRVNSKKKH
ncbi:hypothetical protein KO494_01230 [Lacinutrix sp. C3R15]|nr:MULTISPECIES: hypothetical protein [Flavobacteriaceae]MBU2938150.1 hypothetical protein [Lacinutrix sp. C3R15]MDO6621464.1 hypothetical protein [Oceanihabitans sp. 1_MG-2023]